MLGFDVGSPSRDGSTAVPCSATGASRSSRRPGFTLFGMIPPSNGFARTFWSAAQHLQSSRTPYRLTQVIYFVRGAGWAQMALDLQPAIKLYLLGLYVKACLVDAVADVFCVSFGAVIKSTRRVVKALSMIAPEQIEWLSRSCRTQCHVLPQTDTGFKDASAPLTIQRFRYPPNLLFDLTHSPTESRGTAYIASSRVTGTTMSSASRWGVPAPPRIHWCRAGRMSTSIQLFTTTRVSICCATRACCTQVALSAHSKNQIVPLRREANSTTNQLVCKSRRSMRLVYSRVAGAA